MKNKFSLENKTALKSTFGESSRMNSALREIDVLSVHSHRPILGQRL